MKKIIISFFILFTTQISFSQNLTVSEMINIYQKENIEEINSFITNKGWHFNDSKKNARTYPQKNYDQISWVFYENDYSLSGSLSLLISSNKVETIFYGIFDETYDYFKNSLVSYGFKVVNNDIKDGKIITIYSNGKYEANISISKISDQYKSGIAYFIAFREYN